MNYIPEIPCQCGGNCGLTFRARRDYGYNRRKYALECPVVKERKRLADIARHDAYRAKKRADGTLSAMKAKHNLTQRGGK
jgi:hypothetical protein